MGTQAMHCAYCKKAIEAHGVHVENDGLIFCDAQCDLKYAAAGPKNELLDAAVALVQYFRSGDVKKFNQVARELGTMTGRRVYAEGWASRWVIKNLADGIIMREAGKGAGNSGTH